MKINELKINSFGKLKEKELILKKGINVIYGENEKGKSTLINFILSSLYGISKNKKGKEFSGYDKYLPWQGDSFSGNIEYELNNGKIYRIYRNFKRKNAEIYNEKMEEISKEFNIDKNKGTEIFYEQTKVDEELFISTLLMNQKEVKLENKEQNMLVQKIANLMGTGEDNVFYKKAIDRINKRQLDEVGTDRTKEKPINIATAEIEKLKLEKQELTGIKENEFTIEENKNEIKKNIEENKLRERILKEVKEIFEKEKEETDKIEIRRQINIEKTKNIKKLKEELKNIKEEEEIVIKKLSNQQRQEKENKSNQNKINIILLTIILVMNILIFTIIKKVNINMIFSIIFAIIIFFVNIFQKNKNKHILAEGIRIKQDKEKKQTIIEQIEKDLKNNIEEQRKEDDELLSLNNEIMANTNEEKQKVINRYYNVFENIENIAKLNDSNEVEKAIENVRFILNQEIVEMHKFDVEKDNIKPKIERLAIVEEKLERTSEYLKHLELKNKSINMAKEVLEESYEIMKDNVTPKFTSKLSEIISEITEGKYNNIMLNDKQGLLVENEEGRYVEATRLSEGTIEQLYFSLRLAMIEEISEENMPIILDESFVYYDDNRLRKVLGFLNAQCKKHQVIILTCTRREIEELNKMNIEYNQINL